MPCRMLSLVCVVALVSGSFLSGCGGTDDASEAGAGDSGGAGGSGGSGGDGGPPCAADPESAECLACWAPAAQTCYGGVCVSEYASVQACVAANDCTTDEGATDRACLAEFCGDEQAEVNTCAEAECPELVACGATL